MNFMLNMHENISHEFCIKGTGNCPEIHLSKVFTKLKITDNLFLSILNKFWVIFEEVLNKIFSPWHPRLELAQIQGNMEMQHNQTPLQPSNRRKHIKFDPSDPDMESEFENLELDNMDLRVKKQLIWFIN